MALANKFMTARVCVCACACMYCVCMTWCALTRIGNNNVTTDLPRFDYNFLFVYARVWAWTMITAQRTHKNDNGNAIKKTTAAVTATSAVKVSVGQRCTLLWVVITEILKTDTVVCESVLHNKMQYAPFYLCDSIEMNKHTKHMHCLIISLEIVHRKLW